MVVINPGVIISGKYVGLFSSPAIIIMADATASVVIENYGGIYGIGGIGGKSGGNSLSNSNSTCSPIAAQNGEDGGHAIQIVNAGVKFKINNYGE